MKIVISQMMTLCMEDDFSEIWSHVRQYLPKGVLYMHQFQITIKLAPISKMDMLLHMCLYATTYAYMYMCTIYLYTINIRTYVFISVSLIDK